MVHFRRWATAILFAAICIAIVIFAFLSKKTVGDFSSLAQAISAIVLVFVTISAITRSDAQLKKSDEQLSLMQEQLEISRKQTETLSEQVEIEKQIAGKDSEPSLLVDVNPVFNTTLGGITIDVVNLSNFPIRIASVTIEAVYAYPVRIPLNLSRKSLRPSESAEALFLDEDHVTQINEVIGGPHDGDPDPTKYEDMLDILGVHNWFPFESLEVEYYYGPTGSMRYLNTYRFSLFKMAKTIAIERYWRILLRQQEFSRMVGDGSWVPLWRFTFNGDRRPIDS